MNHNAKPITYWSKIIQQGTLFPHSLRPWLSFMMTHRGLLWLSLPSIPSYRAKNLSKFRKWSAETRWNAAALKYQFHLGFAETLKDELAQVSIQLDRFLHERHSELTQSFQPIWVLPRIPGPTTPTPGSSTFLVHLMWNLCRSVYSDPLWLLKKNSADDRTICLYYRSRGHFLRNCPIQSSKPHQPSHSDLQLSKTQFTHIVLPISLQVAGKEVNLWEVVDSEASSCLIYLNLVKDLHIPRNLKEQRLNIHLADGTTPSTSSEPVTQETIPILATTDTGHQELRFNVIGSPIFSAILGISWLQAHNPQINWSKGEITFLFSHLATVNNTVLSPWMILPRVCSSSPQQIPVLLFHQFIMISLTYFTKGKPILCPCTYPMIVRSNYFPKQRYLLGRSFHCPRRSLKPSDSTLMKT